MAANSAQRERIEEIIGDTYDDYEQISAWETTFQDELETPKTASLLGAPVEVRGFQVGDKEALQCLAAQLAAEPRLKKLCLRVGERQLVVPPASETAFRKALRELDYILPPP